MGAGVTDAISDRQRESGVYDDGGPVEPGAMWALAATLVVSVGLIHTWNRASHRTRYVMEIVGSLAAVAGFVLIFVVPLVRGCLARQ